MGPEGFVPPDAGVCGNKCRWQSPSASSHLLALKTLPTIFRCVAIVAHSRLRPSALTSSSKLVLFPMPAAYGGGAIVPYRARPSVGECDGPRLRYSQVWR